MNLAKYLEIIYSPLRRVGRYDPARDWFVLLTLFAVTLVGILVWNIWTFRMVTDGGTIGPAVTNKASTVFSSVPLDELRSLLDARAAEEMKYKMGGYAFTDPSQ